MGITLFIFNILLSINFITESSLNSLSQKVDLTVYLKESTTNSQVEQITNQLKLLDGVTGVEYTSKEEAISKIRTTYPSLYESFGKYDLGNPLPASLSIRTKNPDFHQEISNYIKGSSISTYISNISESSDESAKEKNIISSVAQNLKRVSDFTHQIIFWLIIIFITGSTLIILNTIQITIFTRRKEVNVMRLVGAKISFIYMPFLIESAIYAILSVTLNLILLWFLSRQINFEGTNLYDFSQGLNIAGLTIFELVATIILGACSSLIAVHNYLKKKIAEEE